MQAMEIFNSLLAKESYSVNACSFTIEHKTVRDIMIQIVEQTKDFSVAYSYVILVSIARLPN